MQVVNETESARPTPADLRRFLEDELAAGKKQIVIPPGVYRVTPEQRHHVRLTRLSDVTIIATGVEMICTETTRAITIADCSNLRIIGLTIDYDPLPYTQGRIVQLSRDNTVHEIELFDGYPSADKVIDEKYEIFRADTRTLRFGSYHNFQHAKLGPKHIEVRREGRYMGEEVGDIIAIGIVHAPGGSIPHAVFITKSENVLLQDITLYASNCFGFFEGDCERTHYLCCKIDRRAATEDIKKRQSPRIRSLNADAYHSKHAIVGPTLENCTAKFMGDDCTNICGDYHVVMQTNGTNLRVLAKDKLNIQPGDPLELVSYSGRRLPDDKAVKIIGPIDQASVEELAFLSKQRMNARFANGDAIQKAYEIVIDREVELPAGSAIAAANRMGNGFKVIGCDFGFNRSQGL